MKLSHEVLLALAYVSQISDPDAVRSRFIESLNGLDGALVFEYVEYLPPGVPEYRILPIATLRSSFGYALMGEEPETSEAERAVFRTAFQFLAVLLENRIQARALESRNESLLKEIKQEKSLVHTVLNTLPVGVWVTDGKGTILMVNAAGEKIWAGTRYIGIDQYGEYKAWWSETGKPVDTEEWAVAQAINAGETLIGQEIDIECFDGTHKTILNSAAPIFDDEGKVIGAVGVNQEITERKRAEEQFRKEYNLRERITDTIPVGITVVNRDGRITFANIAAEKILGLTKESISQRFYNDPLWNIVDLSGEALPDEQLPFRRVMETGIPIYDLKHGIICPDGQRVLLSINATPLRNDSGEITGMVASLTDITNRELMEEKLRESEKRFRQLFTSMSSGFAVHEIILDEAGRPQDYRFLSVNPAFEQLTGLKAEDLIGRTILEVLPSTEKSWIERYGRVAQTGESVQFESYSCDLCRHYEVMAYSPASGQFATIFQDITERKRSEEEKAKLQGQLLQSQKMESVGRLAGGVAHDFNNMLGVIIGHVDIAIDEVDPGHPLHVNLQEVRNAAMRSADLTNQLLAFARKQTIAPKVIDVNKTVEGMLKMLLRLIGEDVHLNWLPFPGLWPVKVDPSQIDQILANLCVNARDAIAGVGKITIETGNITFDEAYCEDNAGFVPGDYILLAVSDDGCGMDKETLGKLFEPFFTTKVVGKGTGLGLATSYGIVKQNNGFINVYSEPGQGTTFRVYLPRHIGKAELARIKEWQEPVSRGHETVLVVEDEPAILNLGKVMLEKQGYQVLTAGTPGEAIRLAEEYVGEIHLLVTDVVMPEMNGRDLAKKMLSLYPNLKRLFMSGYTANVIAHHGVLDDGVYFIQKPFSRKDLVSKVREVLDQK